MYNYSAGILNNDFYRYVEEALPEEYHSQVDPEWIAPHPPVEKEIPEETAETTGVGEGGNAEESKTGEGITEEISITEGDVTEN